MIAKESGIEGHDFKCEKAPLSISKCCSVSAIDRNDIFNSKYYYYIIEKGNIFIDSFKIK